MSSTTQTKPLWTVVKEDELEGEAFVEACEKLRHIYPDKKEEFIKLAKKKLYTMELITVDKYNFKLSSDGTPVRLGLNGSMWCKCFYAPYGYKRQAEGGCSDIAAGRLFVFYWEEIEKKQSGFRCTYVDQVTQIQCASHFENSLDRFMHEKIVHHMEV